MRQTTLARKTHISAPAVDNFHGGGWHWQAELWAREEGFMVTLTCIKSMYMPVGMTQTKLWYGDYLTVRDNIYHDLCALESGIYHQFRRVGKEEMQSVKKT